MQPEVKTNSLELLVAMRTKVLGIRKIRDKFKNVEQKNPN